jgi:ABC-2 type transport system ATP-binding protein
MDEAPAYAIDVRHLTKRFGERTVVDDLAIRLARGRICGFLGPNGSGKTTTIRMLCGLLTPDAGEGTCLGHDIRLDARRIKLEVGYMTQRFGLYEDLTIEENLRFVARVYGMADPAVAATRAVDRLGLGDRRHQLAGALSGGWKQRLALAACLLHEPRLLLLDEPTAGVDPKARRDFWAEIHSLAADGLTVLVSTHYMDEAERCHQIVYLSAGRLLVSGSVEQLLAESGLRTWEVTGPALPALAARIAADRRWLVVPFGTRLHVTSASGEDFVQWHRQLPADPNQAIEIPSGLEDLFISLMNERNNGSERNHGKAGSKRDASASNGGLVH